MYSSNFFFLPKKDLQKCNQIATMMNHKCNAYMLKELCQDIGKKEFQNYGWAKILVDIQLFYIFLALCFNLCSYFFLVWKTYLQIFILSNNKNSTLVHVQVLEKVDRFPHFFQAFNFKFCKIL